MTSKFTAFRIHSEGGRIAARFEPVTLDDLAPGEVVIRVSHSDINYKDALAATGPARSCAATRWSAASTVRASSRPRAMPATGRAMRCS